MITKKDYWNTLSIISLCIAIFYTTFKSLNPGLYDLSALIGVILFIISFYTIIFRGVDNRIFIVISFIFSILLPIIYNITPEQFIEKTLRLLLSTLPMILLASTLIANRETLNQFVQYLFYIGFVIMIVSFFDLIVQSGLLSRGGYAAPILISRSVLLFALVTLYLIIDKKINPLFGAFIIVISLYICIQTESRGPLVAFLISFLFLVLTAIKAKRIVSIVVASILVTTLISYATPSSSLSRITSVFSGNIDISSATRLDAWILGINKFEVKIFGHGLGSFIQENVYGISAGQYIPLEYPHNFIVEAAYEGGIVELSILILILGLLIYSYRNNFELRQSVLPSLVIFTLVNSLFSSDIPGNKEMWVFIFFCIPTHFARRHSNAIQYQ